MPNRKRLPFTRQAKVVGTILFLICMVNMVWSTLLYLEIKAQIHGREQDRQAARMISCQRSERLVKARRLDAWRSWNTLPVTLKLLHVGDTKQVRTLARKNLYRDLRRFAPIDCTAFALHAKEVIVAAPKSESLEGLPPGKKKVVIHDNG
jgi:hypothetical protein